MVPPPSESSSKRSSIFGAVTIVLSLACLAWALHGLNWSELWEDIRELDWRWVATVACVADVLVYVIQGWRWSLLLRPVGPAPIGSSVRAIFVGLFASEVFPLRAGELIRCFLQARWTQIPVSVTLASALIERIFDGIVLIVALFLAGLCPAPAADSWTSPRRGDPGRWQYFSHSVDCPVRRVGGSHVLAPAGARDALERPYVQLDPRDD